MIFKNVEDVWQYLCGYVNFSNIYPCMFRMLWDFFLILLFLVSYFFKSENGCKISVESDAISETGNIDL